MPLQVKEKKGLLKKESLMANALVKDMSGCRGWIGERGVYGIS
jgi:hypothetical protein